MKQHVKKAVIPVAGLATRFFPATKVISKAMLTLIDRPLVQYAIEECQETGIDEFYFISSSRNTDLANHFKRLEDLEDLLEANGKFEAAQTIKECAINAHYINQEKAQGLGHAVWLAKEVIGNEPFAVLLPDDVILNKEKGCMAQMVEAFNQTETSAVIAADEVPDYKIPSYGIIEPEAPEGEFVKIKSVVEKPSIEDAPSNLGITGRYIFKPEIFEHLEHEVNNAEGEIQLTDAIHALISNAPVHALNYQGERYDCGSKEGFVKATLALALEQDLLSDDLQHIMNNMVVAA